MPLSSSGTATLPLYKFLLLSLLVTLLNAPSKFVGLTKSKSYILYPVVGFVFVAIRRLWFIVANIVLKFSPTISSPEINPVGAVYVYVTLPSESIFEISSFLCDIFAPTSQILERFIQDLIFVCELTQLNPRKWPPG